MEVEKCTSCGKNLAAAESFVEFECPDCDEDLARCERCKKLSNEYSCPSCGFSGP
jgi:predicted RNA-binding Zn-ribbon protein involved in translation (DUF1610 family)